MSEKSREQISALMDGEQETGSMFILSAMTHNREFRQTWNRYHLIRDSLRGNLPQHYDSSLADRISQSIENESQFSTSSTITANNSFIKPLAGLAIAASVAMVAILGVRQVGVTPGSSPSEMIASSAPVTMSPVNQSRSTVAVSASSNMTRPDVVHLPADAQSRLNRYLVNYNEYRTNAGVQGMLPYVRIVAHEVEE